MPFNSNSAQGTVVYSTPGFYDQSLILPNDGAAFTSDTLATVSELSIPLGGYERVMGKYTIGYDGSNTTAMQFRVANLAQSDGSTTGADTPAAANLEGTGTYSTDGAGEVVTIDVGADSSGLLLKVEFNVIVSAATKGNLVFQAANIAGQSGADTHLLAGSHVVYKKW